MSIIRSRDQHRVHTVRSAPDYNANPLFPLADLKAWLEIDVADVSQDDLLLSLQESVIIWIENSTWIKLAPYGLTLTIDHFPGQAPRGQLASIGINPSDPLDPSIILIWKPASAVDEIRLTDFEGTSSVYDATNYVVDLGSDNWEGRVYPANGETFWSYSVQLRNLQAVAIDYTTGYATAADIPNGLLTAIKMMVTQLYFNRGDCACMDQCSVNCGASLLISQYMPIIL